MNKSHNLALVGIAIAAVVLAGLLVPFVLRPGNGHPLQFGTTTSPQQSLTEQTKIVTSQTCTLTPSLIEVENTPEQTEGPYFVDEMLDRSDIRSDPSDGSVQGGIPLQLIIHVYNVSNGSCIALSGAHVDIWHANSQGLYSDIQNIGTLGKKYLRGYQVTDDDGIVKFTTIYPGWYEGRALHIHIKVRTFDGPTKTFEWTSQFYLKDSISDKVQLQPPYSNHGPRPLSNDEDSIYNGPSTDGTVQTNSGSHLLLNLSRDGNQGYVGRFNVGVEAK
jgi:protocatechuate 3,4-dioxygenase beta subunit